MGKLCTVRTDILSGKYDKIFTLLYKDAEPARKRYAEAIDSFAELYGSDRDIRLFSAPGRTEIGGNHTDHQHGCVLAAAVDADLIAVVSENGENFVRVKSKGYNEDVVALDDLRVNEENAGKAKALIRGTLDAFSKKGRKLAGFDAYTTSNVLKGSGMSSSAAFEVLIGTIVNEMFNGGAETAVSIAQMAQYAENVHFGKPCGLMDQTASSVGGFIAIDFHDPKAPVVEKVDFDLESHGYCLCIVDAGGNHADLTDDYADITVEMRKVANAFGKDFLRDVDLGEFYGDLKKARDAAGDRGVMRAMHFFADNERAIREKDALMKKSTDEFLRLVKESGDSSFMLLQNLYSPRSFNSQPLSLAIAVSKHILCGKGACRVHGGGFAGTIQAFVPLDMRDAFGKEISKVFGEDACHFLRIRPLGGTEIKCD